MVGFWYTEEGTEKTVELTVDGQGEVVVRRPNPFGTVRVVEGLDQFDPVDEPRALIELLPDAHRRGVRSQRARVKEVDPDPQELSENRAVGRGEVHDPGRDWKAKIRREANNADT